MANGMNEGRLTSLLKRLSERVCDWVIAGVRKMRRAGAACAVSANGTLQKSADWKRSAKRKLVGAEGVIITLALIASLGIVSPLVASAGEPAEASHPVSGVIGETDEGVAAVDVDEDAEAVDAADATTAGDSADSADSDAATDSDAAQDGDGDSASAGDSNGPAGDGADADAEGEDSAEESGAAVDADDADADDGANADEKNDAADDGDADDAKAENAEAEKSDEGKKSDKEKKAAKTVDFKDIPERYRAKGRDIFVTDGGYYNPLGHILANYNIFVREDAGSDDQKIGHVVGPVFVGEDFHNNSYVSGNGYVHKVSSYVGGIWGKPDNGVTSYSSKVNLYLGKNNYDPSIVKGEYKPKLDGKNERTYFTDDDQYVDVDTMFADIEQQAASLDEGAINVAADVDTEYADFVDWGHLYLKAGEHYVIDSEVLKRYTMANRKIILFIDEGVEDVSSLPETIIWSGSTRTQIPLVDSYVVKSASRSYGEEIKFSVKDGGVEYTDGLPLVFVFPNATQVDEPHNTEYGHVVAPKATVKMGVQYNGCVLAKSAILTSQGHMWPYNGKKLFPATTQFKAKKTLRDANSGEELSLDGYEFRFQLWDLKNDRSGVGATSPNPQRGHECLEEVVASDEGEITFNTKPTYTAAGTYYYLIVERDLSQSATRSSNAACPTTPSNNASRFNLSKKEKAKYDLIEYDQHVEHVTVNVTETREGNDVRYEADVTVTPIDGPESKARNGITREGETQVLLFENRRRSTPTAKLQLEKQWVEDESAPDQEFEFEVQLDTSNTVTAETVKSAYVLIDGGTEPVALSLSESGGKLVGTVKLKSGQTAVIHELPDGAAYTVFEREIAGYTLDNLQCSGSAESTTDEVTSCSGRLQAGDTPSATITATNCKTKVALSIAKIVDNYDQILPQDSDLRKALFSFNISLYLEAGNNANAPLSGEYPYEIVGQLVEGQSSSGLLECSSPQNAPATSVCRVKGSGELLQLAHGQTVTINNLLYGTIFNVSEETSSMPDDFIHVSTVLGEPENKTEASGTLTTATGTMVTVTNRYSPKVVLPSTGGKAHPIMTAMFGLGVVCAGLAIAMLYLRRCE